MRVSRKLETCIKMDPCGTLVINLGDFNARTSERLKRFIGKQKKNNER